MTRIIEMVVEPNKLYVGSTFKLKVKVQDDYTKKQLLTSETGLKLITEDGKKFRTDWGD